ncbi:MAG TPA: hypothetical protein VJM33_08175 [Microthrixaceae bacterium]|nr:hypothetical protein [Microthrixaceae bacterium]
MISRERDDGRDERGNGVLSTTFGVGVFLMLLLMAVHVLLNLWVASTVDAVARDAASAVALSGDAPGEIAATERAALSSAHAALGDFADRVDLRFEQDPTGDTVVVRVRTSGLQLVPQFAREALGVGSVDRRVVVRREALR